MRTPLKFVLLAFALAMLAGTSGCGQQIPVATVGVKFDANSGMSEHILKPEWTWVNPLTQQLITYPTSIQNASFVMRSSEGRGGNDAINASTSEGAILPIDITVSYRMPGDVENVKKVFNNFGVPHEDPEHPLREVEDRHIYWATVAALNDVSGPRSIFDLISKQRSQIGPEVRKLLTPRMEEWGFIVEDVMVGEITPPEAITKKVHEQQKIRTDLQTAKINLRQARIDAETIMTNAQREAEQNRLMAQQGNTVMLLKKLERKRLLLERWDGVSPLIGDSPFPKF